MNTFIELVGLCVLTSQIVGVTATERMSGLMDTERNVVTVIMPRVKNFTMPLPASMTSGHSSKAMLAGRTTSLSLSGRNNLVPNVEDHTAMIAFNSCDLISVDGWPVKDLRDNGFLYIELDGEQLSITSDAPNAAVTPTLDKLPLGNLKGTMTEQFTPAGEYSGAAAMLTISEGKLSTCAKAAALKPRTGVRVKSGETEVPINPHIDSHSLRAPRTDTTLTLNADKELTIAAKGKSLVLRAGGWYYIANVPLAYARSLQAMSGAAHFEVYCAMTGAQGIQCAELMARLAGGGGTDTCGTDFRTAKRGIPTNFPLIIDFACSNSQWP